MRSNSVSAAIDRSTLPAAPAQPSADTPPEEQSAVTASKRRMPDNLRRFLLRLQGGKMYLPAAYRIVWFRDECPDWGIETRILEGGQEAGFATVQATVRNAEGRIIATGTKTETRAAFPAGHVEKAETGSVARALSMAGFGTQFMPELDDENGHVADAPVPSSNGGSATSRPAAAAPSLDVTRQAPASIWDGPGQCPRCHAPEGKRHGKECLS